MNMRIVYLLLASMLLAPFAHAAAPAPVDAGVSGECYDADGSGGEAEVEVENGGVYTPGIPFGAVAAVQAFTNDPKGIPAGDGCTAPGDDHLEAHAFVAPVGGVEVCYDGAPDGNGTLLHVYTSDVCDDDAEDDSG